MFHRSLGFMWFVGWFDWTCPFCFVDGRGYRHWIMVNRLDPSLDMTNSSNSHLWEIVKESRKQCVER